MVRCGSRRIFARLFFSLSFLLLFFPASGPAQVTLAAAVNGASYLNAQLPNGKLAQGVLFIAFGQGMGPAAITRASSFPLPTNLAGTSIRATVGGVTVDCIILYTLSTQVAAILPSNTPTGTGTMVLTYNGVSSAPLNITVVARSFGIFALNQAGSGPGVFTNPFNNVANGLTTSANANDLLDIWGTDLGAVSGDERGGPLPGDMTNVNVQVLVGGQPAQVLYRGRSGCCAGVDQIRIAIPAVYGCYVPLYVIVEGVVSNFVTISTAQSGSSCSNPGGYTSSLYQLAQANGSLRIAAIGLSRNFVVAGSQSYQGDAAFAGFTRVALANLFTAGAEPIAGNCYVSQFPGVSVPVPENLDAGPQIAMASPMGNYNLVPPFMGAPFGQYFVFFSPLGGGIQLPGYVTDGTVLQPGNYTFNGPGGAHVGAFQASISLPVKFDWTNRLAGGATVNRGQPLTVAWTNGFPGALVFINGTSSAAPGVGASFTCWANATAGSFTVPAAVLSALPPSYLDGNNNPQGALNVYQQFTEQNFTPPGIDVGILSFSDGFNVGPVRYQ